MLFTTTRLPQGEKWSDTSTPSYSNVEKLSLEEADNVGLKPFTFQMLHNIENVYQNEVMKLYRSGVIKRKVFVPSFDVLLSPAYSDSSSSQSFPTSLYYPLLLPPVSGSISNSNWFISEYNHLYHLFYLFSSPSLSVGSSPTAHSVCINQPNSSSPSGTSFPSTLSSFFLTNLPTPRTMPPHLIRTITDMVIRFLSHIVETHAHHLDVGWKAVFVIVSLLAKCGNESGYDYVYSYVYIVYIVYM
jgi:hypothetical protein